MAAEGSRRHDFPCHLSIPDVASTSVLPGGQGGGACVWAGPEDRPRLPVEIHALLGELPVAMVRVLKGLILDDLHPFPSVALFVAVLADHVQLSDFVLQNTETERSAPALGSGHGAVGTLRRGEKAGADAGA